MHTSFNFIHRDIKPENVLLNAPGLQPNVKKSVVWELKDFCNQVEVKLCDLGLSKSIVQQQGTATQVGTVNFICPETYLGRDYDFKADVWSLGAVTFELFVNQPVMDFYDPGKKDIDLKFADGQVYMPKLEHTTLELLDFLSLALQFEPKDRPSIEEI